VLDTSAGLDPIQSIVLLSDVEREFALELLRAMHAEVAMGRRAAIAVTGSEDSEAVRRMDDAIASTRTALESARPVIEGDSATLDFSPGGGRATTLHFRKVAGKWQFDFLRKYRERNQIDRLGIGVCKARQKAAAITAKIYEDKQEQDLDQLSTIYEAMKAALLARGSSTSGSTSAPHRE
jgi:hypothetical protein